jgi:hypothetical protein
MDWVFDTKSYAHIPKCPICGIEGSGAGLTLRGTTLTLTRDPRVHVKSDKKYWVEVEPYLTKAGKVSNMRMKKFTEGTKIWNTMAARANESFPASIWAEVLKDSCNIRLVCYVAKVLGDIDIRTSTMRVLCNSNTLHPMKHATAFHGEAKGLRKGPDGWADIGKWRSLLEGDATSFENDILNVHKTLEYQMGHKYQTKGRAKLIAKLKDDIATKFEYLDAIQDGEYLGMDRGLLERLNLRHLSREQLNMLSKELPMPLRKEACDYVDEEALRRDIRAKLGDTLAWYDPGKEKHMITDGIRTVSYLDAMEADTSDGDDCPVGLQIAAELDEEPDLVGYDAVLYEDALYGMDDTDTSEDFIIEE